MNQFQATTALKTSSIGTQTDLAGGVEPVNLQNPSDLRIGYIEACWHYEIVERARHSFTAKITESGINESQLEVFQVPGSLEIPLQAKLMAKSGRFDIIVACGLIVNGGIYRHEFVTTSVIDGMMQIQLETEVPILSVVLTPLNFHETAEHQQFFFDHFVKKGEEAANACVRTLANMQKLGATRAQAGV